MTKKKKSTRKTSPKKTKITKAKSKKSTPVTAKVKTVIDGDTFKIDKKIRGKEKIRLANTDAPERGQRGSATAKKNLEKKIKGKSVKIYPKGRSYDRVVAKVKVGGKEVKASPEKTKSQKQKPSAIKTTTKKRTTKKKSKGKK